jgi:hypothetical protein
MKTLFVITVVFLSTTLYADWDIEQKLTPSDATEDDHFGNSVSIDGDYAVIGAVWDDENGYASGSAYIFHRNGTNWIEQTKITASNGSTEDRFGHSVSISGDYAIVGAPYYDDIVENTGEAYIFHRNGTNWTQQARLAVSDVAEEDLFGWSVSISGDYAVVGAVDADDNGSASGCAYVFHRNGTSWILQEKLIASDGERWDNFGQSVAISGDYLVIGAHWDDNDGIRSGSAYIFLEVMAPGLKRRRSLRLMLMTKIGLGIRFLFQETIPLLAHMVTILTAPTQALHISFIEVAQTGQNRRGSLHPMANNLIISVIQLPFQEIMLQLVLLVTVIMVPLIFFTEVVQSGQRIQS